MTYSVQLSLNLSGSIQKLIIFLVSFPFYSWTASFTYILTILKFSAQATKCLHMGLVNLYPWSIFPHLTSNHGFINDFRHFPAKGNCYLERVLNPACAGTGMCSLHTRPPGWRSKPVSCHSSSLLMFVSSVGVLQDASSDFLPTFPPSLSPCTLVSSLFSVKSWSLIKFHFNSPTRLFISSSSFMWYLVAQWGAQGEGETRATQEI